MKSIIERAKIGGLDLVKKLYKKERSLKTAYMSGTDLIIYAYSVLESGSTHSSCRGINIYELLFNKKLGFIEALVGGGDLTINYCLIDLEECKELDDNRSPHDACIQLKTKKEAIECPHRKSKYLVAADYHRRELINKDTIDDMVEYLKTNCCKKSNG